MHNIKQCKLCCFVLLNCVLLWYTVKQEESPIYTTRGLYMVTEARKRANAKWDKENMTILGCRVKKDYAARFRATCVAAGTTPNAVLKQAADDFLKEHPADEESPIEE